MLKKKGIVFLLVMLILSLTIVQAFGETVEDLKKQQQNINKQIDKTKNEIKTIQGKAKDVSKQIEELDLAMDNAATELQKVETQLEDLNLQIDVTLEELRDAEQKVEEQEDNFNQRVRVMYMNGNIGTLEVLLASADVEDFLSRKDMLQYIAEYDKELIRYMKEQRDIIDSKKTELEAQRASVEVTKSKIEARKKDLETATREKEILMGRLQQDIKSFEAEYDKLNDYAKQIESKIVKLQRNTGPYTGGKMDWPVPGHSRISSYYGYRIHPIFKTKKLHTGIDIPAPTGTAIKSAAAGTVIYADWLGGYGKAIMVDHGGGIVTLYGHNSALTAKVGQTVSRGQTIAKAGSTGNSTGPHCHFEVRKNGAYVDPLPWVKGN
ncbi:peptidoglycan DD-metalloendopeptidase family protein [Tissierella sp. Yu-01]|uniref:murein hydrolase activator EnvC family protein n=1 Tax=Tissierella sp. Yu-01 TaxID=3035694 RepID=UPI00240E1445|nr:peptidoglycan DD-metalloendopeptidase family protein [Tissierella sp. Yu-01]WFA09144.1 peptidoglycan DD-metalloendopeptidase family protein [Tissierella sp. Yu-01]